MVGDPLVRCGASMAAGLRRGDRDVAGAVVGVPFSVGASAAIGLSLRWPRTNRHRLP